MVCLRKKSNDKYNKSLRKLIKDKEVKAVLGSGFENNRSKINPDILKDKWEKLELATLPTQFSWELIAITYCREVNSIKQQFPELREILDSQKLAEIAESSKNTEKNTQKIRDLIKNLIPFVPEIDLESYRNSLQDNYGYLKLYYLDISDTHNNIRLWDVFIPQNAREALPPSRCDLPKHVQNKSIKELQEIESYPLEYERVFQRLEEFWQNYFAKPLVPILEIINDINCPLAVILGDPGSGKSSLLRYLALNWLVKPTAQFPILIELRRYISDSLVYTDVLEFLQQGSSAIQHIKKRSLDQQLKSGQTLVMFDGLDEVFDSVKRSNLVNYIICLTNIYPQARVIVSSRIIGYNPDSLRNAEFRHLTLQDFSAKQTSQFIEKWHRLIIRDLGNREELQNRLNDGINNSPAIAELAANPLLLTMMAIINRREELPRKRTELYEQASRVLLYAWDVDHKQLNLFLGSIGNIEKDEILQDIAYEMQANSQGLQGNIIHRTNLLFVLVNYLNNKFPNNSFDKATILVNQLRERNFVLCLLGEEYYGFVHKTFLEYFCAKAFLSKFDKRGLEGGLTIEELQTEVFGKHYQEQSWQEILRLIVGSIAKKSPTFASSIIEYLMDIEIKDNNFNSLFLAAECLAEVNNRIALQDVSEQLLEKIVRLLAGELKSETKESEDKKVKDNPVGETPTERLRRILEERRRERLSESILEDIEEERVYKLIASTWNDEDNALTWLKDYTYSQETLARRKVTLKIIAECWQENSQAWYWLKSLAKSEIDLSLRESALKQIGDRLIASKKYQEAYDYFLETANLFTEQENFEKINKSLFNFFKSLGNKLYNYGYTKNEQDHKLAQKSYEQAISFKSNNSNVFNTYSIASDLCNIYCNIQDYDSALELINTVYNSDFSNQFYRSLLCDIYDKNGSYTRIISLYNTEFSTIDLTTLDYTSLIYAYHFLGDYRKAISLCKKAIDEKKDVASSISKELCWLYTDLGEYKKAIEFGNRAIAKALKNKIGDMLPKASEYNNLGAAYFESGDYEQAINILSEGIEINPNSQGIHYWLGMVYLFQGELSQAERELNLAIRFFPKKSNRFYSLGIINAMKGDMIEARNLWQEALDLSLNNSLDKKLNYQKYRFLLGEVESSIVAIKNIINEFQPPSVLLEQKILKEMKLLAQAPQPPAEIDRLIAMLQQEIETLAKNENFDDL